jgi:hypothetical protein
MFETFQDVRPLPEPIENQQIVAPVEMSGSLRDMSAPSLG